MFKPGDIVVHRTLGAGQVLAIEEKKIDGKLQKFIRVHLKLREGDILLPCTEHGCDDLRPAITTDQIDQIERILQTKTAFRPGLPQTADEMMSPEDLVKSQDPFKIAKAIRRLVDESKGPDFSELHRELLAKARAALASELMQVKKISRAAAYTFITRALRAGDIKAKEQKKKSR
ncbi:MAG: hypothetical protein N3A72_10590 [bacterium]|nr:hypothetical protein [bacterium]